MQEVRNSRVIVAGSKDNGVVVKISKITIFIFSNLN